MPATDRDTADRPATPGRSGRPAVAERLSVALVAEAAAAMDKLKDRTGHKKVDIINRALAVYEFIEAELRAGNELIIRDPDDGKEQLVKIF